MTETPEYMHATSLYQKLRIQSLLMSITALLLLASSFTFAILLLQHLAPLLEESNATDILAENVLQARLQGEAAAYIEAALAANLAIDAIWAYTWLKALEAARVMTERAARIIGEVAATLEVIATALLAIDHAIRLGDFTRHQTLYNMTPTGLGVLAKLVAAPAIAAYYYALRRQAKHLNDNKLKLYATIAAIAGLLQARRLELIGLPLLATSNLLIYKHTSKTKKTNPH